MRRPDQFSRPLTPLEVGGLLGALAMILACCGFCMVLSVYSPGPPPRVATTQAP